MNKEAPSKNKIKRRPAEKQRDITRVGALYLEGRIQAEISSILGISQATVSRDLKFCFEEWEKERIHDINKAKVRELTKIDNLEREYWIAWKRSQEDAQKITTGTSKTQGTYVSTTVEGQVGDARFLQGVMDCIKQRCAILGVEAPKKIENSGNITWKEFLDGDASPDNK